MLKTSRVFSSFRQLPVHNSLLSTSVRQTRLIRPQARLLQPSAEQRAFSTKKSSKWSPKPIFSPLTRTLPLRAPRNIRHNGTKASPQESSSKSLSLSERMKQMSRKYGWTVVGTYLALSVLDFPFCFMAVRLFGTERIAQVEHAVLDTAWGFLESVAPSLKERREKKEAEAALAELAEGSEGSEVVAKQHHADASIWTQLLLAYGVHKSLIFIRIPITLTITPRVVKVLRSWGWKIGNTAAKTA